MLRIVALVFAGLCLNLTSGQVTTPGRCPNLPTQRNLNPLKYSGVWYEYKRFFTFFQQGVDCSRAIYTLNPDGSIGVLNTGFNKREGRPSSIRGVARIADPRDPGKLILRFPMLPVADYWVLSTDYKTYSVVYSCRDGMNSRGPTKSETVYIITRQRGYLSNKTRKNIFTNLTRLGIDVTEFRTTDQTQCPPGF